MSQNDVYDSEGYGAEKVNALKNSRRAYAGKITNCINKVTDLMHKGHDWILTLA